MPTYIGENKIVDRYLGDRFLEAAYIGDKKVYDPYTEITGYLPMIYKSRAAVALKNYRIHGTSSGAGVETENLFDYTAQNTDNGFNANKYLNGVGGVNDSSSHNISEYIEIEPSTVYSLCQPRAQLAVSMCFYNSEKSFISSVVEGNAITTVTSPANAKYVRFTILISYQSEIMFVQGSTAPTSYIPYGYKIPISLESGERTNNTPSASNYDLFLGDTKLYEDEYLDFVEQKVYKTIALTTHDDKTFTTSDNNRFCVRRSNNG